MTSKTLGLRGYSRRKGVSPGTVAKWITNGRIEKSVTRDARGRPTIDVALADEEARANRHDTMDRDHNKPHRRPHGRTIGLSELHPAVGAVYKIRQALEKLTDAVWRMRGTEKDCGAVLEALQAIPPHLRLVEDELAARGVPLLKDAG